MPVILFVYNRPDLTARTLEALSSQEIPKLYVFSDGARTPDDELLVEQTRELMRGIDWTDVTLVKRSTNLGLGISVRTGVTEVFERHGAAIMFEDDLVCVSGTYAYLCGALERYRDDHRVMSVTGWTHPMIVPEGLGDEPYFDGKGECWVWGTWADRWEGMDAPAVDIMHACAARGIDILGYGTDMPKMAAEATGRNLWAIGWWYLHLLRGALCLRPPHSLVEHTGWDGRGTTVNPSMLNWKNPPLEPCPPQPEVWPEPVEHPACTRLWRIAIDGND